MHTVSVTGSQHFRRERRDYYYLLLVHDIMHTSIIDSTVTNLDTWTHASHVGAKYFINVISAFTPFDDVL